MFQTQAIHNAEKFKQMEIAFFVKLDEENSENSILKVLFKKLLERSW